MQTQTISDTRRILIIDDNKAIHEDFQKVLLRRQEPAEILSLEADLFETTPQAENTLPDFELEFALQGTEGLDKVRDAVANDRRFDMAFVDIRIPPGWDGVETATRLLQADPGLQIVFCTAYSDYSTEDILGQFGVADNVLILRKPFDPGEIELLAICLTQKRRAETERKRVTECQSATLSRATAIMDELENRNASLINDSNDLLDDSSRLSASLNETVERLVQAEDFALYAMASMVEARDAATGKHLARMQIFAQIIAEYLSQHGPYQSVIDDEFLHTFHRSTILHDIGKVGIPDGILLKPGKLTTAEFEIMKQHTVIGDEILTRAAAHSSYSDIIGMACGIARSHHERWDGTGYPDRIPGVHIPLAARITSVADAFDAMTSNRIHQNAVSELQARAIIKEESGRQFDPHIVEAFLHVYVDICDRRKNINSIETPTLAPLAAID